MKRIQFVAGALLGSLGIYCTNDMITDDDSGPIPDANGETSCETCPLEQPTTVFDGVLSPSWDEEEWECVTPVLDIAKFRTFTVHLPAPVNSLYNLRAEVGHGTEGVFNSIQRTLEFDEVGVHDGRLGTALRFRFSNVDTQESCGEISAPATVVGFVNR